MVDRHQAGVGKGAESAAEIGVATGDIEAFDAEVAAAIKQPLMIGAAFEAHPAESIHSSGKHPIDRMITVAAVVENVEPSPEIRLEPRGNGPSMVETRDEIVGIDLLAKPGSHDRTARADEGHTPAADKRLKAHGSAVADRQRRSGELGEADSPVLELA
jgi:hypothetical protein